MKKRELSENSWKNFAMAIGRHNINKRRGVMNEGFHGLQCKIQMQFWLRSQGQDRVPPQ
jgi:hypothetical protein